MICSFKQLIFPPLESDLQPGSYVVAIYQLHEKLLDLRKNRIREVKVVGYSLPTTPKIHFDMQGHWANNTKHGVQFEMETYQELIQPTREGIITYLSSGMIKGVGPKIAEKIYDAFGNDTLDILDQAPDKLLSIPGISKNKLERIRDSYLSSRGARDIIALLVPHGITPGMAVRILQKYGIHAMDTVRQHPYWLCEMDGVGFKTADDIAKKMGKDPLDPERICAGLLQALKEAEKKGHLCLEKAEFIRQGVMLLDTDGLTEEKAAVAAFKLLQENKLVLYHNHAYRDTIARAEQTVADCLKELLDLAPIRYPSNLDNEIEEAQKKMGISLAPEQCDAIKTCLTSHICIITGGPGTGKTLIQRVLLDLYRKYNADANITCCAPTGRAARRMEQCTGYPASTIHSALHLLAGENGEFGEPEALDADLVLVDEVSMLDINLAKDLLNALQYGCQLILVGDADQLPSVGPGAVLSELIACGRIPVIKLDKVYRQSAGSRIAVNAKIIRHGNTALEYGEDFKLVESSDLTHSADLLVELYCRQIAQHGIDNVILLSPFRKKTETGTNALNERLQAVVNPPVSGKSEVQHGKRLFRLGDKVMQIKNKNDISNGDVGYITDISSYSSGIYVQVEFDAGRIAEYEGSDLDLLELAYASTIHKSQGSEYKSVLINMQTAHYPMLKRPLPYTAITRAIERVTIVGERKALCMAIGRVDAEKRRTLLAKRINEKYTSNVANY